MRRALLSTLLALSLGAQGPGSQDLSRLPAWAKEAALQAAKETPPAADAWVLLERHASTYLGKGEVREETFRLVRILGQRGLSEGRYAVPSLGSAQVLETLKGWNLRPDGELVQLNRKDVRVVDTDTPGVASTLTYSDASLTRLAVGSLVAFQTEQTCRWPLGPVDGFGMLETVPVRRWEFLPAVRQPWLGPALVAETRVETRHLAAWGLSPEGLPGGGIALLNLPALPRDEAYHPPPHGVLPRLELRFLDPALKELPGLATWDGLATWLERAWRPLLQPAGQIDSKGLAPREALARILAWQDRELIYKQVYLTPDRGWLPLSGPEVARRRNGDCKDHAACFLGEAAAAGLQGCPVLCGIGPVTVEPDQPPFPFAFNHAIAAVRLTETLGLPAEVDTAQGRFLLVDATDRFCPLGRLPGDHRGRRVLLCTEQGALWAEVPAGAPLLPVLAVDLQGELDPLGRSRAKVHLRETGNARGLRAAALQGGLTRLAAQDLRLLFDLPPAATVAEVTMGDPLDLDHPFEVSCTLARAGGFAVTTGRAGLEPWGLPAPLRAMQKPGVPRVYPVAVRQDGTLDYHATWTFPMAVTPRLPALDAGTPFHDLHWTATAEGRTVTLDLHLTGKDALFEGGQREAGVTAWKRERLLFDRLNEEGRAFRIRD